MARIRTVKPEYWTDERVGECSIPARLLFIACWNFADDHGGLDRSPKQLKAQAFPYDNIDCEPLVQELLNQRLLIEYEVSGKKYLHISGFRKHQKNEKPAAPRFPVYVPAEGSTERSGGATDISGGSTESSCGSTAPSSGSSSSLGKIKEGNGREEAPPARESGNGIKPEGEMAIALRELGVEVRSTDPVLHEWLRDGFTVAQAVESVGIARIRKPWPERIPANYLDPILRKPPKPPQQRLSKYERSKQALGETEDVGFG